MSQNLVGNLSAFTSEIGAIPPALSSTYSRGSSLALCTWDAHQWQTQKPPRLTDTSPPSFISPDGQG